MRGFPQVVPLSEWRAARAALLIEEKAATRARDALAAKRRRLPMVRIEEDYVFEAEGGRLRLIDLFEGRRQLILYHFMFAPDVCGWPSAGCEGCSWYIDNVGHLAHLQARDTSFAAVSLAPLENIVKYKQRMGWKIPWVSSSASRFNHDFGITGDGPEKSGTSVFLRVGEEVFRTYFTTGRGDETLGNFWSYLDITPFGRQETWEDSPDGWPSTPAYDWWRRHDRYQAEETLEGGS